MKRILLILTAVLALLTVEDAASAAIIFDTFNLGIDIGSSSGNPIGGFIDPEDNYDFAMQFTLNNDASLGQLELDAAIISGENVLDAFIVSDNGGFPGLTTLDSFHFVDELLPFSEGGSRLSQVSVINPLLSGGTPYWLVLSTTGVDSHLVWLVRRDENRTLIQASRENDSALWEYGINFNGNPQPNTLFPNRFRLHDTADAVVPEPATAALLGTGLAGFIMIRRRK